MVQGLVLVLGSARLLDEGTRGRGGQVQVNKEEQAQQCNEMNWLSQLSSSIRGIFSHFTRHIVVLVDNPP